MNAVDALAPLLADPLQVALIVDYDGTLSPIVEDAAAARPHPDAHALLTRLRDRLGLVAVVSGRPVDFLEPILPKGLVLAGLYGLEVRTDVGRRTHPQSGNWREVVDDVAGRAEIRGPKGIVVERKGGLSLTLHYRSVPEQEAATAAYAADEAMRSGLVARPARMSWELHPPIEVDKGTAVLDLVGELGVVAFAGDDQGDLPGYDALDELDRRGVTTVRIAVDSPEAPVELLERADIVVDGPDGLVALLETLG